MTPPRVRQWLKEKDVSPMSNVRLEHTHLNPNLLLRNRIRDWPEERHKEIVRGMSILLS